MKSIMSDAALLTKAIPKIKYSFQTKVNPLSLPKVNKSQDVYQILLKQWDRHKLEFIEQFKVLLLSRSNRALGILTASTGGTSGTVAEPKLVFAPAIARNASSIIVAHNHPSGNVKPSDADIQLTKKLVEAGKLLEVPILDHLIISKVGYYSFADDGLM